MNSLIGKTLGLFSLVFAASAAFAAPPLSCDKGTPNCIQVTFDAKTGDYSVYTLQIGGFPLSSQIPNANPSLDGHLVVQKGTSKLAFRYSNVTKPDEDLGTVTFPVVPADQSIMAMAYAFDQDVKVDGSSKKDTVTYCDSKENTEFGVATKSKYAAMDYTLQFSRPGSETVELNYQQVLNEIGSYPAIFGCGKDK